MDITIWYVPGFRRFDEWTSGVDPSRAALPPMVERHSTPSDPTWDAWTAEFTKDHREGWCLHVFKNERLSGMGRVSVIRGEIGKYFGDPDALVLAGQESREVDVKLLRCPAAGSAEEYVSWLEANVLRVEVDGASLWENPGIDGNPQDEGPQ